MKIGRNALCPCGSGKKYKKCCHGKSSGKKPVQDAVMIKLINDLHRFVDKHHVTLMASAIPQYWGDIDIDEDLSDVERAIVEGCFHEWLIFDFIAEENRTFIDLFIDDNNKNKLTPEELEVLSVMRKSSVSLYEVEDVFTGRGVLLKDVLLGDSYELFDVEISNYMRKGNMLATRLIHLDGKYVIVGAGHPFQQIDKDELVKFVGEKYAGYCRENPGASMGDFLKKAPMVFNDFWCRQSMESDPEKLQEMIDEFSNVSLAVYNVTDRQGIIRRMDAMEGVFKIEGEKDDEGYNEDDEKEPLKWHSEVITQDGEKIKAIFDMYHGNFNLTCNHKDWFEKWKTRVDERLSGLVVFERDALLSDVFDAVKDKIMPQKKPASERAGESGK